MSLRSTAALLITAFLSFSGSVGAQDPPNGTACPQELLDSGGVCLTKEQRGKLVEAVEELRDVHESKAEVKVTDPIVIIRDWQDRVYVNGGDQKPIKVNLKIGSHVDRDLEVRLPIHVFYREKPPDPFFRLRFRAQFGVLPPELVRSIKNAASSDPPEVDGGFQSFWYAGVDMDFFHASLFNVNIHLGSAGAGGGVGLDITKNFGVTAGAIVKWQEWKPSMLVGTYFCF